MLLALHPLPPAVSGGVKSRRLAALDADLAPAPLSFLPPPPPPLSRKMDATAAELVDEKKLAFECLADAAKAAAGAAGGAKL